MQLVNDFMCQYPSWAELLAEVLHKVITQLIHKTKLEFLPYVLEHQGAGSPESLNTYNCKQVQNRSQLFPVSLRPLFPPAISQTVDCLISTMLLFSLLASLFSSVLVKRTAIPTLISI